MRKQFPLILLLVLILLSGCTSQTTSASEGTNTPTTSLYLAMTPQPEDSQPLHSATPASTSAGGPGRAEYTSIPATNAPPETATPADWKSWPILPVVSAEMRAVYRLGLENGNDPHSFSILGDCQSLPEEFLGVYDNDSSVLAALPDPLQETVRYFSGSFDRYSPTVKNGTTTGALLWGEWNDNEENQCQPGETPLDCELRVHRPSIVIINIGTHWETRNYRYLTIIFERIIEHGAVPGWQPKPTTENWMSASTRIWPIWLKNSICRYGTSGLPCRIFPMAAWTLTVPGNSATRRKRFTACLPFRRWMPFGAR